MGHTAVLYEMGHVLRGQTDTKLDRSLIIVLNQADGAIQFRPLQIARIKITHERFKVSGDAGEDWTVPDITWVNGVPDCGKTTWVLRNFESRRDMALTARREAGGRRAAIY
ncbi:hypothetical protein EVAR_49418_1 [Eumeta japonica]|uniref:Uncharacterized protein n=1 Tax=Eumeta variegata TaxID=151549 RepID=A0A4C1Y583_EUMVA|nr:hypothetical protein EVAR_49418_1 [Eumeta japonica]